jgi:hypothetical protein
MKGIQKLNGLLRKSKSYLKRSSPTILTCIGAIGVVATSVMAVKVTPKAVDLIRADSRQNHDGDPYAYTKLEAVQSCWQCYIPAALVGLSTITCIVGINALNKRNQASLTSAYALLSESYQRYRKSANTVYGEDADSKIKAQMAKDTYVSADGYSVYSADLDLESEKILCYDLFSQRYFTATMAAVLNAQYHVNRNLCLRGDTTINEFYEFLGIEPINHGDEIGWSMDEFLEGGIMWLDFENSQSVLDDGMECCVISALWDPNKFDY